MTDILIGHDNHFSIYILKYHIVYLKYVQYNVIKNQLEYFINKIKETNSITNPWHPSSKERNFMLNIFLW